MNKVWITAAFTAGIICLVANAANAQTDSDFLLKTRYRNARIDVNIGFGPKTNFNSVQWIKLRSLDPKKRFHIGGGLRVFNLNYNGLVMKAEGANRTGFTRFPASGRMVGLNLIFAAECIFNDEYGFGANVDVLGTSLGTVSPSDGQHDFVYSKEGSPGITPGEIGGQISGVNTRIPGRGLGSYTTEVFAMYKVKKRTWLKVSYSRLATDLILSHPQDRFVAKGNLVSAGVRFQY